MRKAQKFAAQFENYAHLLSQPGGREMAQQKHFDAMGALRLLTEAVEASDHWVEKSKRMAANY